MVKNTKNPEASGRRGFGVGQAASALDRLFGTWLDTVWKFGLLYALWIGLAHTVMTNAADSAVVQLAAIGYWFGWLFLAMTVVLGAFIAVTSWLDRRRLAPSSSQH